jgi:hypothetical protein
VGGPLCCRSRSYPRAQSDGADPPAGSGECRTRARAGEPAGGAPQASGAPVLRWQGDREPLAPLLAPARQHRPPPARGHTGSEPVLVNPALVPWPIRRLHPHTLRQSEPGKLVRETSQVKRRERTVQRRSVKRGTEQRRTSDATTLSSASSTSSTVSFASPSGRLLSVRRFTGRLSSVRLSLVRLSSVRLSTARWIFRPPFFLLSSPH